MIAKIWKDKSPPHTKSVWSKNDATKNHSHKCDDGKNNNNYYSKNQPLFQFYPSIQLITPSMNSSEDSTAEGNEPNHSNSYTHHQKLLRENGLDYFKIFFLPATGPKGLITTGFESDFLNQYLSNKIHGHKWFVGASTGALRNAALISSICRHDLLLKSKANMKTFDTQKLDKTATHRTHRKVTTHEKKEPCYPYPNATLDMINQFCDMYYKQGDTPDTLKPMMQKMYQLVAPLDLLEDIINHPTLHLAILVSAFDESYVDCHDYTLKATLGWMGAKYALMDHCLGRHVKRLCFYTGDEPPHFLNHVNTDMNKSCSCLSSSSNHLFSEPDRIHKRSNMKYEHIFTDSRRCSSIHNSNDLHFYKLTKENFHQVLFATTCIPFIQQRCTHIDGYGEGVFMDGAITDLMLTIKITNPDLPSLLISDSFDGYLAQSVFDVWTPWKSTPQCFYQNCSIVCPSKNVLQYFNDGKLPTVKDYFNTLYITKPYKRRKKFMTANQLSVKNWPKSWDFELSPRTMKHNEKPEQQTKLILNHSFSSSSSSTASFPYLFSYLGGYGKGLMFALFVAFMTVNTIVNS